jgi:predicted acylesterase/phospholipase RssA
MVFAERDRGFIDELRQRTGERLQKQDDHLLLEASRRSSIIPIPVADENKGLFQRSNFRELLTAYTMSAKQALADVRREVEDDIEIEDIIFE